MKFIFLFSALLCLAFASKQDVINEESVVECNESSEIVRCAEIFEYCMSVHQPAKMLNFICQHSSPTALQLGEMLLMSVKKGCFEMFDFLLFLGATPGYKDDEPMRQACTLGHLQFVFRLLAIPGVPSNRRQSEFLEIAIRRSNLYLVDMLFDQKAVKNMDEFHNVYVRMAAEVGHPAIFKLLLDEVTFMTGREVTSPRGRLGKNPRFLLSGTIRNGQFYPRETPLVLFEELLRKVLMCDTHALVPVLFSSNTLVGRILPDSVLNCWDSAYENALSSQMKLQLVKFLLRVKVNLSRKVSEEKHLFNIPMILDSSKVFLWMKHITDEFYHVPLELTMLVASKLLE